MKKFNVQFNIKVDDEISASDVQELIKAYIENHNRYFGKISNVKVKKCQAV